MAPPTPSTSQLAPAIPNSAFDSQAAKPARARTAKARGKAPARKVTRTPTQSGEGDEYDLAPGRVKRRSKAASSKGEKEGGPLKRRKEGQKGGGPSQAEGERERERPAGSSQPRTKPNRPASASHAHQIKRLTTRPAPSSPSDHLSDPGSDHSLPPPRLGPTAFPASHPYESDPAAPDPSDWADPRNLPRPVTNQGRQVRRADEWRALELGGYRVALHDVATDQLADLGRTLVEWEGISRWRKRIEDDQAARRAMQDEEDGFGVGLADESPIGAPPSSSQPLTQPPPAQQPITHTFQPAQTQTSTADDNNDDTLPLPTSTFLSQMARWPLHPSLLCAPPPLARQRQKPYELARFPRSRDHDSPLPLAESVTFLIQREARKLRQRLPPRTRPHALAQARSAYAPGGPLCSAGGDAPAGSDAGESEDEGNLSSHSLDSDLDEDEAEVRVELEGRTGELLAGLSGLVEKGPMPALDYWTRKARGDAAEPSRREKGVGWEDVMGLVRGLDGLPSQVAAKLQARLKAVYQPQLSADPNYSSLDTPANLDLGPASVAPGPSALIPSSPLPPFNILPPTDDDSDATVAREPSPLPFVRNTPHTRLLASQLPTPPATADALVPVGELGAPKAGPAAPLAAEADPAAEAAGQRKREAGGADEAGHKAKKAKVVGKGGKDREQERRAKAAKRRSLRAGFL